MKQAYTIFYRFPEKLISSTCTLYNQRRQSAVYISQSLDAALSAPGMKLSLGVVDVRRHSAVLRGCCACLTFSSPRLELGAPPDDRVVDRPLAAPRCEPLPSVTTAHVTVSHAYCSS